MPEEGDDLPKAAGPPRARLGLPTRASARPAAPRATAEGGGGGSTTTASAETPGKVALARRAVAKRARDDAARAAAAADADRDSELEAALEAEVERADRAETRLNEVELSHSAYRPGSTSSPRRRGPPRRTATPRSSLPRRAARTPASGRSRRRRTTCRRQTRRLGMQ